MRIKEIVAVSGLSGLYKTQTQKPNGLIVTSLTEGWTKFISNRLHLFSPLENVSIYTDSDTIDLVDVFIEIHKQKESNQPADAKAGNDELRNWFLKIVPNHDKEKVHISDIKKLIKWYAILDEKGVIENEIKAREEDAAKEQEHKETLEVKQEQEEQKSADPEEKVVKEKKKSTKKIE